MLIVIPRSRSSGALSMFANSVNDVVRRILIRQHLRDRRGQRRLPMIDVTHRPDVHMGLGALELLFAIGFP
jgi:hypothetical protein